MYGSFSGGVVYTNHYSNTDLCMPAEQAKIVARNCDFLDDKHFLVWLSISRRYRNEKQEIRRGNLMQFVTIFTLHAHTHTFVYFGFDGFCNTYEHNFMFINQLKKNFIFLE